MNSFDSGLEPRSSAPGAAGVLLAPASSSLATRRPFERVSLSNQFVLTTAVILIGGILVFGAWVGRQIESSTVNRAAAVAAVYVESILATQLEREGWGRDAPLSPAMRARLDDVFVASPLRRKIVSFKLWSANGIVLYSTERQVEGRRYAPSEHLGAALVGNVHAAISSLDDEDEDPERRHGSPLLEVYVPVRAGGSGEVIAVAEFYHAMENMQRDVRRSQAQSWVLVIGGAIAIFALLYGLVRRANGTILDQQRDLREKLKALRLTLAENREMHERISAAGARTTALNEQLLRRVAADLHDGPAQDLAFSLMRFDELMGVCACDCAHGSTARRDMEAVHGALRASLDELRAISAGLGVPGIGALSLAETLGRAKRDVSWHAELKVCSEIDDTLQEAPLAVKITAYRLVQESLTNCWRHARGTPVRLRVWRAADGRAVCIEVADDGPGFDADAVAESGRLGLAFMRERVRLLGGEFDIVSAPGQGTTLRASIPLDVPEQAHA